MRTTLTIEEQLFRELKETAHRLGLPFKQVVNQALRSGLERMKRPGPQKKYKGKAYSMGFPPGENFDKALAIATALDDEEIIRKLNLRK